MTIKFGVWIPVYGGHRTSFGRIYGLEPQPSFEYAKQVALMADRLGFHSIWIPDHLLNPVLGKEERCFEAWTTLTALAALTRTVKLGHVVLCAAFRYPAVLAKMGATLDEVSGGRFILSMGAGWFREEYEAYGIPYDEEHDVRVEKEREAILLIKAMWTKRKVNFNGKYIHIKDAYLEPKPAKRLPIWVTGTSPKTKMLAAEVADVWLMRWASPERVKEEIASMRRFKRATGRRLQYAIPALVLMGSTRSEAVDRVEFFMRRGGMKPEDALANSIVGSTEDCVATIREYIRAGVDYFILQFNPSLEGLKLFAEEVLPKFTNKK